MPAFGKVHSSIHTAADRVKSGLKWGHRLGMDNRIMQGLGAMDKMRSGMINRHQDVLDHIGENSALVGKIRQSQQMMQPSGVI